MKSQLLKTFCLYSLIVLLFLWLAFDAKGQPADSPWPMFRHDQKHTGQSKYKGADKPMLQWKFQIGREIHSSPAVGIDHTIYVGGGILHAINIDGTLKWKTGLFNFDSSPAISADSTIHIGSNYFYAFNYDGTKKWEDYYTGNTSSAALTSRYIYVIGGNLLTAYFYSGTISWDEDISWVLPGFPSSPAVGNDETVYVGIHGYSNHYPGLCAVRYGSIKWLFKTEDDVTSSPAIGYDGTIYFGSLDSTFYAVNPDGTIKWKYKTEDKIISSPAISSVATIYVGSNDNNLYAFEADGTLKWKFNTGDNVESSPAIDSEGIIYLGSNDGNLYSIKPDGSINWKYKTDGKIFSSPAIGYTGSIYVGSDDGYLYAIGKSPYPRIILSDSHIDFGNTLVGNSREKILTIYNYGDEPLHVTNIQSNSNDFAVSPNSFTIQVDSSQDIIAKFIPSSTSTVKSTIKISCNDPDNSEVNISLSGCGINLDISDLSILNVTTSSMLLKWTSPGNKSVGNKANKYDIRYFKDYINNSNWDFATRVSNPPTPFSAGTSQNYNLDDLNSNTSYFVALKASDDAGNWSDISNVISATTVDTTEESTWNITDVDGGISFSLSSLALGNNTPYIAYYGGDILYFARSNGNSWSNEIIGHASDVNSLSLSMDKNAYPYILYQASGDLKYSFYNGSTWQTKSIPLDEISEFSSLLIDGNGRLHFSYYDPNAQNLKYAYSDGSVWNFQTVDSNGNVGKSPSLCLSNNNKPYISYFDVTNKDLKYAFLNGSSWQISVVDTGKVKPYSSILLDNNGYPNISYCTYTETIDWEDQGIVINKGPDIHHLKYAHYNGNSWTVDEIASTTGSNLILSLDHEGKPHIVYYQGERVWTDYIPTIGYTNSYIKLISTEYAYKTGSYWNKETVFDEYMPGSYIMDSNKNLHYCTTSNGSVEYNFQVGSTWQGTQVVHAQDIVGGYNCLALDSHGNPHISYYDYTNEDLKYAYYDGSSWVIQAVDTTDNTGKYISFKLDNNNNPHIAYCKITYTSQYAWDSGELKYAHFDGSTWRIETIDSNNKNSLNSIAIDVNGYPHISYFGWNYFNHAYFNGTVWIIETVDKDVGNLSYPSYNSICIDSYGHLHIAYTESFIKDNVTQRNLKYASFDGTIWQTEFLDSLGTNPSIALDQDDNPNICYTSIWSASPENPGYGYYLKNAFRNGYNWEKEIICDKTQGKISMISDRSGYLHVLFRLYAGGVLYAMCKDQQWRAYELGIETYDYSLDIDKVGHPHLSCYYNKGLKYLSNPVLTEVEFSHNHNNGLPIAFRLLQNYPNPFNPTTTIRYELSLKSNVKLSIYNILGQMVKKVVDKNQQAGIYTVTWNSKDDFDRPVSSGIYFCHMQAGDFVKTVKIMLIR